MGLLPINLGRVLLSLDMLNVFFLFSFSPPRPKGDRVLLGGPGSFYWQGEIRHLSHREVDLFDFFSLSSSSFVSTLLQSLSKPLSVRKLTEIIFLHPLKYFLNNQGNHRVKLE